MNKRLKRQYYSTNELNLIRVVNLIKARRFSDGTSPEVVKLMGYRDSLMQKVVREQRMGRARIHTDNLRKLFPNRRSKQ